MNNLYRANYTQKRGTSAPQNKRFSFKMATNNTIKSLNEVGYFFNNLNHILKYVKLYKLLK